MSTNPGEARIGGVVGAGRRRSRAPDGRCGCYARRAGRLVHVNAGHPAPFLWVPGRDGLRRLPPTGPLITPALPSSAWRTETLDGIAGARLLVHTDGLTDAAADGDEPFGEERLAAVVARHPAGGAALVDALLDEMRAFTGGRAQNDDVTLLAASLT